MRYTLIASLQYGKLFNGKQKTVIILSLIISILFPLFTIAIFVMSFYDSISMDSSLIFAFVFWNCLSLFLFIILMYLYMRDKDIRKKIAVWIKDAISIDASLKIKENEHYKVTHQIVVCFSYEGKYYEKYSKRGNFFWGYDKFFIEYAKHCEWKTQILYSPHYEQVMLLKT